MINIMENNQRDHFVIIQLNKVGIQVMVQQPTWAAASFSFNIIVTSDPRVTTNKVRHKTPLFLLFDDDIPKAAYLFIFFS